MGAFAETTNAIIFLGGHAAENNSWNADLITKVSGKSHSFHVNISVYVCVFLPSSREEVQVITMPPAPPDKANACGSVEGQQASNDDGALSSGCKDK